MASAYPNGVSLGRMFFGESMFSRQPDASKVAFAHLARQLLHRMVLASSYDRF